MWPYSETIFKLARSYIGLQWVSLQENEQCGQRATQEEHDSGMGHTDWWQPPDARRGARRKTDSPTESPERN